MDSSRTVLVVGLGASNLAVIGWLASNSIPYLGWDDQEAVRNSLINQGYRIANSVAEIDWTRIGRVILSPGVPYHFPETSRIVSEAEYRNIQVSGDMALFFEILKSKNHSITSIGITGTNGKSTTTALVAEILKQANIASQYGGNFGIPVMDLLNSPTADTILLEISSYQLDLNINHGFSIAALLNITPDHLDRHGGMAGYCTAKKKIFAGQGKDDYAIVSLDDQYCQSIAKKLNRQRLITVSVHADSSADVFVESDSLFYSENGVRAKKYDFKNSKYLQGIHNYQNAAVAFAIAKSLEINESVIFDCFDRFAGLAHRQELIASFQNMRFINDSKATNADACAPALRTFANIVWLVGGVEKSGGIESLLPSLGSVKFAIPYGQAKDSFTQSLRKSSAIRTESVDTIEQATRMAIDYCQMNPETEFTILLSPAAASFDQFRNFEHRGEVFREIVKNQIKQRAL